MTRTQFVDQSPPSVPASPGPALLARAAGGDPSHLVKQAAAEAARPVNPAALSEDSALSEARKERR